MRLMSDKRQKNQLALDFTGARRGEAPSTSQQGTEPLNGEARSRKPGHGRDRNEGRLRAGKLQAGMGTGQGQQRESGRGRHDGPAVARLPKEHWPVIREQLLSGTYNRNRSGGRKSPSRTEAGWKAGHSHRAGSPHPQAVLRFCKSAGTGRFPSTATGFVLAVGAAGGAGQSISPKVSLVRDLDLEKFFDRVWHDKLMAKIAERVNDKRLRKLIRGFSRREYWKRAGESGG